MFSTYDQWKTRSPDDERRDRCAFECTRCEDEGCMECCPPQPVELEDLDQIADDIWAATDGRFVGSDIADDGAKIAGCSAKGATEPHEGGAEGSNPSRSTTYTRDEPLDPMSGVEFPFADNH